MGNDYLKFLDWLIFVFLKSDLLDKVEAAQQIKTT